MFWFPLNSVEFFFWFDVKKVDANKIRNLFVLSFCTWNDWIYNRTFHLRNQRFANQKLIATLQMPSLVYCYLKIKKWLYVKCFVNIVQHFFDENYVKATVLQKEITRKRCTVWKLQCGNVWNLPPLQKFSWNQLIVRLSSLY